MNPLLAISDLSVTFATDRGQVQALDGVSLSLNAGETLAVVGESGSGKSVTALSIMGLLGDSGRVSDGSIEFDGEDLTKVSGQRLREIRGNQIAFIFQEPMSSLNPVLTIGTQVAEPIWLHHKKSWSEAFEQAGELLRRVAIPDAVNRLEDYPHQFSGGMRQRVMIAMALACQPKLIIADEPTTALDVTVQAQILSLLKNLTKEANSSLILITHDLGVVARYADNVAVMYGGRVIETASARELYKNPQHPYTEGLMASIPKLDGDPGSSLYTIEGQPPDLSNLPPGCSFNPRCPHAQDKCIMTKPTLSEVAPNHLRACFGYER
jgi:oligopeptide transport system ATP-binding protein